MSADTLQTGREERQGWALDDRHIPKAVVGYICQDDYWWCPAIGYSIPASKLYSSEAEAREAGIAELQREAESIKERLTQLGAREAVR